MTVAEERATGLRRGTLVSAVAHLLLAALMAFAAVDSEAMDATMFALLGLAAVLGAGAALVLRSASTRSADGTGRVNLAVALVALSFVTGVAAAMVGGTFAALLSPTLTVVITGILVASARAVQSAPG